MKILTIAKNTFKETIRDRILYAILIFAALFIVSTIFLGSLSLGEDLRIIKDFGLAGIYIFSLIIAVFLGGSLIYKEIEQRTLYIVLSKPVKTYQFILGKFFGLLLSITISILIMTCVYLILVAAKGGGFDTSGLMAIIFSIFEISILIALTILFSTFSTPLLSTIYTIVIIYIGHSLNLLVKYGSKTGGFFKYFSVIIYYLLPNLEKFNLRSGIVPHPSQFLFSILYSLLYTAIILYLANLSLRKQEL